MPDSPPRWPAFPRSPRPDRSRHGTANRPARSWAGRGLATLSRVSVWEVVASGASALLGGAAGAWWYTSRAALRSGPSSLQPSMPQQPGLGQRMRFLPERHALYEEFFVASSAAFMAVGRYQMAQRKSDEQALAEVASNGDKGAATEELGQQAEQAVERVRLVSYRLEMRDVPPEILQAVREYVASLDGILALQWIPAEMHLSEERVRRLMRSDLDFEPSHTEDGA
jgi:hypothetical protein